MKRGLVVVDLQNEYLPTGKLPLSGIEAAVENASRVISHARNSRIPVFHIRHEADNSDVGIFIKGSDGAQIQPAVAPDGNEPVIVKKHINAFRETDLKQQLDAFEVDDIVVVGAMSHMCVDGITRAAVLRFAVEAQMEVEERNFTIAEAQAAEAIAGVAAPPETLNGTPWFERLRAGERLVMARGMAVRGREPGLAAAIGHPAFRIGAPDQPPGGTGISTRSVSAASIAGVGRCQLRSRKTLKPW